MIIDLDKSLNIMNTEILKDMKFQLPSIIFTTDTCEPVIQKIKSENRSTGQFLGMGTAGKKIDSKQREFFESKQATSTKYQNILE